MYNGQKIKELLRENNVKNKQLIDAMGWSGQSALKQVVEGNPTASSLERIADFFGISIDTLFKRNFPVNPSRAHSGEAMDQHPLTDDRFEKLATMEALIAEKDRHIRTLEQTNHLLHSLLTKSGILPADSAENSDNIPTE